MTSVDIGEGSGWLRLTLHPRDDHRVARVTITPKGIGGGPVVNNARDLLALARQFTTACEELAWHLPVGAHPETDEERAADDGQGSLFEEAGT